MIFLFTDFGAADLYVGQVKAALHQATPEARVVDLLHEAPAFNVKADRYPNLTLKKILNAVLKCCEWGKDDYSLQVENLPKAPEAPHPDSLPEGEGKKGKPGQQALDLA